MSKLYQQLQPTFQAIHDNIEAIPIVRLLGDILYVDGTPYDLSDNNGVGISDISKTGTNGLVDTYTIRMTDGSSYQFSVTNGDASDSKIQNFINTWLAAHPEATTTVEDGSITLEKLNGTLQNYLGARPNHNFKYNSSIAEGTNTFLALFQKVKNEVMDEYRGDMDKIPIIVCTDQHGQLSGKKQFFDDINTCVNWYDISKFFNLGDTVTSITGTFTDDVSEITSIGALQTAMNVLSPIPMDKQVNVFGNHDTWCSKSGAQGYKKLPQYILAQYFRNVQGQRASNSGYFAVKDDYFNVKYVILSAFEYPVADGETCTNETASTEQIAWLINELSKKDGYDIVIVAHEPLFPDWEGRSYESRLTSADSSVNHSNRWARLNTDDIFVSRKLKHSGSFTDSSGIVHTYNFSGMKEDLLCGIDGHLHYDCSQYTENDEFLCESFGAWKEGYIYFALIDRRNEQINVWKIDYTNLVYENYQVPFAIPSSAGTYSIKRRLANVSTYQISITIREGQPFFDKLTPASGYTIGTVVVLMGGLDVTSQYYDSTTHEIFIPSVNGDIDITAYSDGWDTNRYVVTYRMNNVYGNKSTVYEENYYLPISVSEDSAYSDHITPGVKNQSGNYVMYDLSIVHDGTDLVIGGTDEISRAGYNISIPSVTGDIDISAKAIRTTFTTGIIDTNGNIDDTQTSYHTTQFVPIDGAIAGKIRTSPSSLGGTVYVGFYDADKSFINRGSTTTHGGNIYVPSEARYVRLSYSSTSGNTITMVPIKNTSYTGTITVNATDLVVGSVPETIRLGESLDISLTGTEAGVIIIDSVVGAANYDLKNGVLTLDHVTGNATVTCHLKKTVLYELPSEITLAATTMNTGVTPVTSVEDSVTYMFEFSLGNVTANNPYLFNTTKGGNNGWYLRRALQGAQVEGKYAGQTLSANGQNRHSTPVGTHCKGVFVHEGGANSVLGTLYLLTQGEAEPTIYTVNGTKSYRLDAGALILGSANGTSTIYSLKVLSTVATAADIAEFLTFAE